MIRWNGKNYIPAGVKPVMKSRRGAAVPGQPNARWVAGWIGGLGVPPAPPTPPPCDFVPSVIEYYHIETQAGDLLITQSGDNIDWFPL